VLRAELGKPAPDFTLPDLEGRRVSLSEHRGKVVVLEWFNPECPFVNLAHDKGSLRGLAGRHTAKGVVWIAVNSGAPGKQGHGASVNQEAKRRFAMSHPIVLDEQGTVGRAYGAERTPHLFIVDGTGKLVYRGAIDNSPDGEGESPSGGRLVNYVDAALADIAVGRAVAQADTEAYGCTVKYAR
jgi:peroxiredoxin